MERVTHALQAIATVITLAGILLYFLGWTYLYSYFSFYRIDVYEIEPSIQYVLVNAFPVLRYALFYVFRFPISLVVFLALLAAWYITLNLIEPKQRPAVVSALATATAVFVLFVAYDSAWRSGLTNARDRWSNDSNPVLLAGEIVKESCDVSQFEMNSTSPLSCFSKYSMLRDIISTSKYHYLFSSPNCLTKKYQTCGGLIFRVSLDGSSYMTSLHVGELR